jgi:hypothetical protein
MYKLMVIRFAPLCNPASWSIKTYFMSFVPYLSVGDTPTEVFGMLTDTGITDILDVRIQ